MIDELRRIQNIAQSVIDESLEKTPNHETIRELLRACKLIDGYYKECCNEMDDNMGDPAGTSYDCGMSVEFQIESDWWHDVSLALRKLQN